jgi:hypothetical protein
MEGNTPNLNSSRLPINTNGQLQSRVEKLKQEVLKPDVPPERKLPWLIDILLYPFSASGAIHLAIFLFTPILIRRFVLHGIDIFFGLLSLGLYALLIGYFFYYIGYCIFDSSRGGLRAPDVTIYDAPEKGELVSQLFFILGATGVCFLPATAYFIITEQTGFIFWLLLAPGIILLPMVLLTAVMFDSLGALNPILIFTSIYRTFYPYCGLVLIFSLIAGLVGQIISGLPIPRELIGFFFYISSVLDYLLGTVLFPQKIAAIYLAMVSAHLLGRFYMRYKEKLNWEV